MMSDVRHAIRVLFAQPLFTLVALVTLALGIGANTAIFSLVQNILLAPPPYRDGDRLVFTWNSYPKMGLPQANVSIPDYLDRRTQAPAIDESTLYASLNLNLADEGRPERIRALRVTPSFFATFQAPPAVGQAFAESHATPGNDKVVVLTHDLWSSRFASDRSIVGRDLRLNGESYRVLGVMPASFVPPGREIGLLVPFAFTPEQMSDEGRGNEFSTMVARLRPGATIAQLDAQMKAIVARNADRIPGAKAWVESSGFTGYAIGYQDQIVGDVRPALLVLQTGVIIVLLIACANVANLQLVRATGRQRELAIRATLGAASRQLVRQLVVEGLVLSIAGGALGVGLGALGVRALKAIGTTQLPRAGEVALNLPVLAFTLSLAVVTGIVFGLVPAMLLFRGRFMTVLKEDSGRGSAGRRTSLFRNGLVVAEVAFALMLLVGAGLLVRSFARLQQVDPGFEVRNTLTGLVTLPQTRYATQAQVSSFWDRVLERTRAVPGVAAAGLVTVMPFGGGNSQGSYGIVGYTPAAGEARPHAQIQNVDAGFFEALRIPVRAGRIFSTSDVAGAPRVVVVDEVMVRRYFKDSNPIGRQIGRGSAEPWTIIGVVGTIRKLNLAEPVEKETLYFPAAQSASALRTMGLVVKTGLEPSTLVEPIRAVIRGIDAEQPIFDVRTMTERVSLSLEQRRTPMLLIGAFAALALLLAAVGLYGVLAFAVSQRVRELGIRQALGAARSDILALVLRQGMVIAGIGVVLGVGAAFWLTAFLRTQLFGIGPRDPIVLTSVPVLLLLVALVACLIPALRATRIDPVEALRD
jgi:putative ABC transport system permease protein